MAKHKCSECGSTMKRVGDIRFKGREVNGLKCSKCGYEEIDLEQVTAIAKIEKHRDMTAKVFKSGNSYAVRLPKALVQALGLHDGEELKVTAKKHGIELTA